MAKLKARKDGRISKRVKKTDGTWKVVYGKTPAELKQKVEYWQKVYHTAPKNFDEKLTVFEVAEEWWTFKKKGKSGASDQESVRSHLNKYILPAVGHMNLVDVTLTDIQLILNNIAAEELSESLQKKVRATVKYVWKHAVGKQITNYNPALFVDIVPVKPKKVEPLEPEELERILDVCKNWRDLKDADGKSYCRNGYKGTRPERCNLAVNLGCFCGFRRGEIIALKWTSMDESDRTFQIVEAADTTENTPVNKDPKTEAGFRRVPIPDAVWELLEATPRDSEYIVPSDKNTEMSKSAFRKMMEPLQKKLTFKFTFHQTRHTFATLCAELEVPEDMCQYLMGHQEPWITRKVYQRVRNRRIYKAAGVLNGIKDFALKDDKLVKL